MTLGTKEETRSRISEAQVKGQMISTKTANHIIKGKGRHWEATRSFAAGAARNH